MILMFQTDFNVENNSGRDIYIIPVGVSETGPRMVLPMSYWSFPMIPAYERSVLLKVTGQQR